MEEPAETREETKDSRGFGIYALWAGVVLVLYVLSWGPLVRWEDPLVRMGLPRDIGLLYMPWMWAYDKTPLHKPLGMYLHVWCPEEIDKNGDMREVIR
jgi:hypothetical protein